MYICMLNRRWAVHTLLTEQENSATRPACSEAVELGTLSPQDCLSSETATPRCQPDMSTLVSS